ncbi:MAG: type II toxin-antitoxin system Phd/YefM family antitoxin [Coraliomargarita sp.]
MKRVNIYEAKTRLSQIVAQVEEGTEAYVVCRNGKPVADIVPHQSRDAVLEPLAELSGASFVGDPCDPVSEEDWPEALR